MDRGADTEMGRACLPFAASGINRLVVDLFDGELAGYDGSFGLFLRRFSVWTRLGCQPHHYRFYTAGALR
jgi:hypothetical protein